MRELVNHRTDTAVSPGSFFAPIHLLHGIEEEGRSLDLKRVAHDGASTLRAPPLAFSANLHTAFNFDTPALLVYTVPEALVRDHLCPSTALLDSRQLDTG
jgi:hypothetical protein